ncbi:MULTISPECIES: PilZ domain-containing protein [Pseudomonas]|uniref:PilZ domain-containing protein n=1 Tax=Pseudomonas segetis TaxID=298908 RepID=A0A239FFX1_9PSED|nr:MULTISPECIES: PilZ domain-containing protein [Pseudomonas]SNS55920.1 PilZ domain-containing protein [Pseudomonas segetis]
MSNNRQHPRTTMKCMIKISHPDFADVIAQTRDLSDGGVYVKHEALRSLKLGDVVTGQVQGMPIEAPILQMVVTRVDAEGVGLRFVTE